MEYLWTATFADGHIIKQPEDDKYSKHNSELEHNPSAFQDIYDYQETSTLYKFTLSNGTIEYSIYLDNDSEIIYYRNMELKFINGIADSNNVVSYTIGYKNNKEEKVIEINAQ